MTVLSVVQGAASRLTLTRPDAIVGVADAGTAQFLELLTEECESLHKDHDWSKLIKVRSFTAAAGLPQSGEFPSDFARLTEGGEIWNTSNNWALKGPITPQDWSFMVVRSVSSTPQYWRNIAGVLNIFTGVAGETIRYEYVSNEWCFLEGDPGEPSDVIENDEDTFVFPEELLKVALRWRWKQAKALDYAEDMGTYERMKAKFILQDKGGTTSFSTMRPDDMFDSRAMRRTWPGIIVP